MKTHAKFAFLIVAIIGVLTWLAVGGTNESKIYYKTISELKAMGNVGVEERMRVGGDVTDGSIVRQGRQVRFTLQQDQLRLPVIYDSMEPLPDTFKGGAQALADGRLGADGVFQASKIQAKCASKYEAKPTNKPAINDKRAAGSETSTERPGPAQRL